MEYCANNYTKPCKYKQYRACILYHNKQQHLFALKILQKYERILGKTIFIAIEAATQFYRAEEYHQKYYLKH
jgi:peptide-methionine (S)-S-oxide reductase